MRVLVLGGYGLIGSAIVRTLLADGHTVTGLGRSARTGQSLIPQARWVEADLRHMTSPDSWTPHLQGIQAVVNASGALQDGARDDLKAVQQDAIIALVKACERAGVSRFVQISAAGAHARAGTTFMRTKAAADAALRKSPLAWTILRPGLVIARQAYGGTSLLRALAGLPLVSATVHANAPIQTIGVDDVAEAVSRCLGHPDLAGTDADLVEPEAQTLAGVISQFRNWLGTGKAALDINMPPPLAKAVATMADLAGVLGWRSPLRSTALNVLKEGVTGDASQTTRLLGRPAYSLADTLAQMPSTVQDRWHARMMLVFPLILLGLAAFWIMSGLVGLVQMDAATNVLASSPVAPIAGVLVAGGAALDIVLGLGVLIRRTARLAAMGMIALTASYLVMGTILTPEIWSDPLGAFSKSALLVLLPLILLILLEER